MKLSALKTGLLFAMLVAFGTLGVNAQSKGERKEPPTFTELLEKMDKNEDSISKEELEKAPKPKGRPKN